MKLGYQKSYAYHVETCRKQGVTPLTLKEFSAIAIQSILICREVKNVKSN